MDIQFRLNPKQSNWLLAVLRDLPTRGVDEAFIQVTTFQAINKAVSEADKQAQAAKLPPELEAAPPADAEPKPPAEEAPKE